MCCNNIETIHHLFFDCTTLEYKKSVRVVFHFKNNIKRKLCMYIIYVITKCYALCM